MEDFLLVKYILSPLEKTKNSTNGCSSVSMKLIVALLLSVTHSQNKFTI